MRKMNTTKAGLAAPPGRPYGRRTRQTGSILESNYIAQLNAEKDRAEALIKADTVRYETRDRTLPVIQGSLTGGSRTERQRRRMLYLDQLMYSKNEQMKRKLLDLVDNIHQEEQEHLAGDLSKCRGEMRQW